MCQVITDEFGRPNNRPERSDKLSSFSYRERREKWLAQSLLLRLRKDQSEDRNLIEIPLSSLFF